MQQSVGRFLLLNLSHVKQVSRLRILINLNTNSG
jgi:hypothetical protein